MSGRKGGISVTAAWPGGPQTIKARYSVLSYWSLSCSHGLHCVVAMSYSENNKNNIVVPGEVSNKKPVCVTRSK